MTATEIANSLRGKMSTEDIVKLLVDMEYEQAKLRKQQREMEEEQQRQAEVIAMHDERLARLEQKVALAEREIAHYTPLLESLRQQERQLDNKVWYLTDRGLPCAGIQKTLDQVREKAYRIETKIIKAQNERDNARAKM